MQQIDKSITVACIESLDDWNQLSDHWDLLLLKEPQASVFNTASFLQTFWAHFLKHTSQLFIILMRDASEELIGAAPFVIQRRRVAGFPMRVLCLMTHPMLIDRPQFLIPTRRAEQLKALFSFLIKHHSQWDILELNEQVLDTDYLESLSTCFDVGAKYRKDIIEFSFQPYLKIYPDFATWDNYLQTRSTKHRKKWRYYQNRAKKEGKLSVTRHSVINELPFAISEYAKIEKRSWKEGTDAKLKGTHFKFFLDLAENIQKKGSIHFVFMRLDNQPIAGLIGLSFGNRYAAMQSSYDAVFTHFSPGFLIGGFDIRWAIEHKIDDYDFMSGYLTDKLLWTDTFRKTYFVRIIRRATWGGLFFFTKFVVNPSVLKVASLLRIEGPFLKNQTDRNILLKKSKFKKHNINLKTHEVD